MKITIELDDDKIKELSGYINEVEVLIKDLKSAVHRLESCKLGILGFEVSFPENTDGETGYKLPIADNIKDMLDGLTIRREGFYGESKTK